MGCFENIINNNFDTTDTNANDELNAFETENGAIAKYITRVTLEDGFEARNLKVFLDLNQQDECSVEIYGKISTREDETDFDELGYFKMIPEVDTNLYLKTSLTLEKFRLLFQRMHSILQGQNRVE